MLGCRHGALGVAPAAHVAVPIIVAKPAGRVIDVPRAIGLQQFQCRHSVGLACGRVHLKLSRDVQAHGLSNDTALPPMPDPPPERMGEAARKALSRATTAVKRYGWISFWVQLTLSVVSAVILLFSVAFTSQSGPRASLYLTLLGILAGFLSTFWNFSYTRTGIKMQRYLEAPPGTDVPKVKKQNVVDMVTRGVIINLLGLGSTLLGVQALVGVLVAKTLSNASANPFIASAAGVYNPVLALDVFLVQAATNMLLGHFLSMVCSLWLLSIVGEGRGLRFQSADKEATPPPTMSGISGSSYRMAPVSEPQYGN